MKAVTGTGKIWGSQETVTVELIDGKLLVSPSIFQEYFDDLVSHQIPVGGSYHPPKNSLLSAWNVLSFMFFDAPNPEITVEGKLERIPYKKGRIY